MKKFLFLAIGLLMFVAAQATTAYDVGQQPQNEKVLLLQQADVQPMVMDFVYADYTVETIATVTGTEYTIYEAAPAEVRTQVFDFTLPVFRLCSHRANMSKSQIVNSWRWHNTNPPNQYDRA